MPSPPKDPSQRRRRNAEPPKRATATALPEVNRRKAPPPPTGLPKRLHPAYREVWRSSVAHLWPASSAPLVARLVRLRDYVNKAPLDELRPATLSVLLQLERELLLGPKAARASGVTVRDEAADVPAPVAADDDEAARPRRRSTVTKDRRERVLRVVK